MDNEIKRTRNECKPLYLKLKENYANLKTVFKIKEVLNLTSVVKQKPESSKPKDLIEYLFKISSYSERLIFIRNSLYYEERGVKILLKKANVEMQNSYFLSLKRQDRAIVATHVLAEFQIALEDIESKIKIVSDSIDHLNNVQFNVKTTISFLKEEKYGYKGNN